MSIHGSRNQSQRRHLLLNLMIAIMLVSSLPTWLAASEETVKSLIGRWEGTIAIKEPWRRLTIESITKDGDQWVGKGRWSVTETGKGTPIDLTIVDAGERVGVSFKSGGDNNVDLQLTGERELTGKFNHMFGRQRRNADMTLKKVD